MGIFCHFRFPITVQMIMSSCDTEGVKVGQKLHFKLQISGASCMTNDQGDKASTCEQKSRVAVDLGAHSEPEPGHR